MKLQRVPMWIAVAAASALILTFVFRSPSPETLLAKARLALAERRPQAAVDLAAEVLRRRPDSSEALLVSATGSADLKKFRQAVEYCQRVPDDDVGQFFKAKRLQGELLLNQIGDLSAAQQTFESVLKISPDSSFALRELSFVYSVQTRTQELVPLQIAILRKGDSTLDDILPLIQGDLLYPNIEAISHYRKTAPDHPGLLLAEARLAQLRKDHPTSRQLLEQALRIQPDLGAAHARLGMLFQESGSESDLLNWSRDLPKSALRHPTTWNVLARIHLKSGNLETAAACAWNAGRLDPGSLPANYQLGHVLTSLGRAAEAKPFVERVAKLERYRKIFDGGRVSGTDPRRIGALIEESSKLAESLGFLWEAQAFARIALRHRDGAEWASRTIERLKGRLRQLSSERVAPEENPFVTLDLADVPISDVAGDWGRSEQTRELHNQPENPIFTDVSGDAKFEFSFQNGNDRTISGAQHPFDFTGGGIAVLDFDLDSWPDIYCTQGGYPNAHVPVPNAEDQLFRNYRGASFMRVSATAIPPDEQYGQGVAVGDINADGFADIFVSNLGENRLLHNNGDGTFTDVSSAIPNNGEQWTTSCLIVDLNTDGITDLYAVNYLSGDIIDRLCRNENGRVASCAPQDFPADQDRLYVGDGQGRFVDMTTQMGIEQANGKGLGIAAADTNGNHRLELLVANDGVPNFYLQSQGDDQTFRFTESAMLQGLAVNGSGMSEACMGIAAEDLDQDGQLDFVVTNFLDETNTLYQGKQMGLVFEDRTWQSGLAASSRRRLGFGIQAVDGDLDGLSDLIVVNGHVDDFRDQDVPFQMPPTYYRNLGGLRFGELPAASAGVYFASRRLGRSLARIDWNRDGREDIIADICMKNTLCYRIQQNRRATIWRFGYSKRHHVPIRSALLWRL